MARADYHTHTPLCLHAEGSPEEYVRQALTLGLADYGISDHMPMPHDEPVPFDSWRMKTAQLPLYREWIDRARTAAAGRDLRVLAALECDWLPGIEPVIRELRAQGGWDYLIGSVHYLGSRGSVDDSLYAREPLSDSVEEDWALYREAVLSMVQSGLFDVVGHMDLVKIWGRRTQELLTLFWEPVLDAIEERGLVVELNTAGRYKPCGTFYPDEDVLRELLRRQIPVVIDSDAHAPSHLSRDWETALRLLRDLAPRGLCECRCAAPVSGTELHAFLSR